MENSMQHQLVLHYYCMFLTAKALLIRKKYFPKSHEGLISLFGQVYVKQDEFDRKTAKYLSRAQSLREEADYDAYDGITEKIAKIWINHAEEFMKEAEKFL